MKHWLSIIGVMTLAACGSDSPEPNHSTSSAQQATSSSSSASANNVPRVAPASNQGNGTKDGDSDAESKMMAYTNAAETRIRACGDNACLEKELKGLSKQLKTVNSAQLSIEQSKRLVKRFMDLQRLVGKLSK